MSKMAHSNRGLFINYFLIAVLFLITAFIVIHFSSTMNGSLPEQEVCSDRFERKKYTKQQQEKFLECIKNQADKFVTSDYAEIKDLSKTFLSLLVAVFVASIAFSEKIVNFGNAGQFARLSMILCWLLLLFAIILCGTALAYMTQAAGIATYDPYLNYWIIEDRAAGLMISSGVCFGGGLVAMMMTGIIAIMHPSSNESDSKDLSEHH